MVYMATRHTGAIREDCTAVYVGVMAAAIGEGAWPAVLSMRTLMTESNARLNKEARSYLVIASAMLGNWLNAIETWLRARDANEVPLSGSAHRCLRGIALMVRNATMRAAVLADLAAYPDEDTRTKKAQPLDELDVPP